MHRHWTRRVGALLFGVWFVLAGIDTGAADACPMQGMAQASASGMPMAVRAAPARGGAHSMSMASMGAETDHRSDSGDTHHTHCPCCGSSCSAMLLGVPVRRDYAATLVPPAITPMAIANDAPAAWVDFILPFPTAPPSAQSA